MYPIFILLSIADSYSEEITFRNNSEIKKLKNELLQYQSENTILRNSILALHSEVYGARLAAKYLDKELAGRIQQLQLLGKEMRTDIKDKLWRQLESEILLHRHKTVIRACRNRTNHEFIRPDSRILSFSQSEQKFLKNDFMTDPLTKFDVSRTGDAAFFSKYESATPSDAFDQTASPEKKESDGSSSSDEQNVDNVNNNSKESDITLISLDSAELPKETTEVEKTEDEKMEKELKADENEKNAPTANEEDFSCVIGEKRTVVVKRQSGQGLGISITVISFSYTQIVTLIQGIHVYTCM